MACKYAITHLNLLDRVQIAAEIAAAENRPTKTLVICCDSFFRVWIYSGLYPYSLNNTYLTCSKRWHLKSPAVASKDTV